MGSQAVPCRGGTRAAAPFYPTPTVLGTVSPAHRGFGPVRSEANIHAQGLQMNPEMPRSAAAAGSRRGDPAPLGLPAQAWDARWEEELWAWKSEGESE